MSNQKYTTEETKALEEKPLTQWAQLLLQKEMEEDLQELQVHLDAPLSEDLLALKKELLGGEEETVSPLEQVWNNIQTQVFSFLDSLTELGQPMAAAGLASDGAATAALEEELPFQSVFQSDELGVELRLRSEGLCLHFLGDALPALGDIEVFTNQTDGEFAPVRCDVLEQMEDELLLHLGAVEELNGHTIRLVFPHEGKVLRSSFHLN